MELVRSKVWVRLLETDPRGSGYPWPRVPAQYYSLILSANMSLVAYGSSDESDSEESSAAPQSKGLFSVLPAPKKPRSTGGSGGPRKEIKASRSPGNSTSNDGLTVEPQPSKEGLFSSLPKPRKRTEPVKITVPQIQRRDVSVESYQTVCLHTVPLLLAVLHNLFCCCLQPDSDDDNDEPVKKKVQPQVRMSHPVVTFLSTELFLPQLLWQLFK